jgi:hypothetical protein
VVAWRDAARTAVCTNRNRLKSGVGKQEMRERREMVERGTGTKEDREGEGLGALSAINPINSAILSSSAHDLACPSYYADLRQYEFVVGSFRHPMVPLSRMAVTAIATYASEITPSEGAALSRASLERCVGDRTRRV